MYGWIHTCLEKLILTRFGEVVWQNIKNEAKCSYKNGEFLRYDMYTDEQTFALVGASCKVLNLDMDAVLEVFGDYFMEYVRDEGYLNMLTLLGSNLREWLVNVNDLHKHLKNSLPDAKFPDFWCTDDDEPDGIHESMILHYYSQRGSVLNAINVGIVKNVAKFFFKLKIEMKKFAVQDVDDSEFTSWRVIILGPIDATPADATAATIKEDIKGHSSDAAVASSNPPPGCPFHK